MSCRWFVPAAVVLLSAVPATRADGQSLPTTSGRVLEAADGDVVLLPREARVTIVTRSQVHARLVYVAAQQTLLLLTDPALGFGTGQPEAKGFFRWQVQEPWRLEPRWEGSATIDEYMPANRVPFGVAIHTDRGTILVSPGHEAPATLSPAPVAVVRSRSASRRSARGSFDEIEQAWLAGGDNALNGAGPIAGARLQAFGGVPGGVSSVAPGAPAGAVRVGGNIRAPMKVRSAEPVYPPLAQSAGVQGVIILELHIDREGAVADARILRSIPLLDQAALDAVRQWRYTPTLLNGAPVPVIMTATVNFVLPATP